MYVQRYGQFFNGIIIIICTYQKSVFKKVVYNLYKNSIIQKLYVYRIFHNLVHFQSLNCIEFIQWCFLNKFRIFNFYRDRVNYTMAHRVKIIQIVYLRPMNMMLWDMVFLWFFSLAFFHSYAFSLIISMSCSTNQSLKSENPR